MRFIFLTGNILFAAFSEELINGLQRTRLHKLLPNDNDTGGLEIPPVHQLSGESHLEFTQAQKKLQVQEFNSVYNYK